MQWFYADKFGELPSGQAEKVEALVAIAEQLERIANALEAHNEPENPNILHGVELDRAMAAKEKEG